MNPIVRRSIILGTPLVLGILDLFHPTLSTGIYNGVAANLTWWVTLHILQLPLFCLLALSAYLLLDGVQGTFATLSKIALGFFVIFYPALDALLGIGTGSLVQYAMGSGNLTVLVMRDAIGSFFLDSPFTDLVGTLGSFGWAIAILLAALALSRPVRSRWLVIVIAVLIGLAMAYYQIVRVQLIPEILPITDLSRLVLLLAIALGLATRPHLAVGLLVMAAYLLAMDHALPSGPAAMGCYFVAALQLEYFPEKTALTERNPVSSEQEMVLDPS